MENKVRAIRDSKGTLIGLHGLSRDITERKRMEEKLRTSEDKFSKAFFTSPDAIAITQLDNGMYVSVNEGFMQVLGVESQINTHAPVGHNEQ